MSSRRRRWQPFRPAICLRPSSRYRLTIAMRLEVGYTLLLAGPRASQEVVVDRRGRFRPPDYRDLVSRCEGQFRPCSQSRQFGWVVELESLSQRLVDTNALKVTRQVADNALDERCWLRLVGSVAAELELALRGLEATDTTRPDDPFRIFSSDT